MENMLALLVWMISSRRLMMMAAWERVYRWWWRRWNSHPSRLPYTATRCRSFAAIVCFVTAILPREESHQPANAVNLRLDIVILQKPSKRRVVVLDSHSHHLEDYLKRIEVLYSAHPTYFTPEVPYRSRSWGNIGRRRRGRGGSTCSEWLPLCGSRQKEPRSRSCLACTQVSVAGRSGPAVSTFRALGLWGRKRNGSVARPLWWYCSFEGWLVRSPTRGPTIWF